MTPREQIIDITLRGRCEYSREDVRRLAQGSICDDPVSYLFGEITKMINDRAYEMRMPITQEDIDKVVGS